MAFSSNDYFLCRTRNGDLTRHFILSSKGKNHTSAVVILEGVAEEEAGKGFERRPRGEWQLQGPPAEGVGPFVDLIPYNSASLSQWASMPSASAYVF